MVLSRRAGPSLVLKVMAGDTISIGAKAFYKSIGSPQHKQLVPAGDMAAALLRAFGGGEPGGGDKEASVAATSRSPFNDQFINDGYRRMKEKEPQEGPQANRPKAYLNFALFDDQFNLVEANSGVRQVKAEPDQLQTLSQDKMVIKQGEFLYVYTSNETPQDVFFDNLVVTNSPGPVLEETHYYPFGLTKAGLSTKAVNKLEQNKYGYNGKELQNGEFADGGGWEWYDYGARMYDQQIGRWHAIDPKVEKYASITPYNYALNNPILYIDPDGRDSRVSIDSSKRSITLSSTIYITGYNAKEQVKKYNQFLKDNAELLSGTFKDGEDEWSVNIDINYQEATEDDIDRIKNGDSNGDNLIEINANGEYANVASVDGKMGNTLNIKKDPNNILSPTIARYDPSGKMAVLGVNYGKSATQRALAGFHETMHMVIGLSDRYYKNNNQWAGAHSGYNTDVMGIHAGYLGKLTMSANHWNNLGAFILKSGHFSGNILNVVVDKTPDYSQKLK